MKKKTTSSYNQNDEQLWLLQEPVAIYSPHPQSHVYSLIQSIKEGLPFESFTKLLKKIPFTINEWCTFLHISDRTMQRYKKSNKAFEPAHSERIMEIALLYQYGISVFGDADNFHTWMEATNMAMGGIKPKELLDTSFGIEAVKDELGRIEHGVLA